MLIAAADTETTGIPRAAFNDPSFPYLAALTFIIYDTDAQRIQASFNTMIQPDGWEMPPEAGAVNGLDMETLTQYGIPVADALCVAHSLLAPVALIVGHNVAFDVNILAGAFYRSDMFDALDSLQAKEAFCTMRESKNIVQAKTVNGRAKMPRLGEAYEFFFDRPLDNAHSANADAVAALELYMAIQQHRVEQAENEVKI